MLPLATVLVDKKRRLSFCSFSGGSVRRRFGAKKPGHAHCIDHSVDGTTGLDAMSHHSIALAGASLWGPRLHQSHQARKDSCSFFLQTATGRREHCDRAYFVQSREKKRALAGLRRNGMPVLRPKRMDL